MTLNVPGSDTTLSCTAIVPVLGFPAVKCMRRSCSGFSRLVLELLHFQRFTALAFEGEMFQDSA